MSFWLKKLNKLGITVLTFYFLVVLFMGWTTHKNEQLKVMAFTQDYASTLKKQAENVLYAETNSLKIIQKKWNASNTERERAYLKNNIQDQTWYNTALSTVMFLDADYQTTWLETLPGYTDKNNQEMLLTDSFVEHLTKQSSSLSVKLSKPLRTSDGEIHFIASFPLTDNLASDGYLVGIYDFNKVIQNLNKDKNFQKFNVAFYASDEKIFTNNTKQIKAENTVTQTFQISDQTWQIKIAPTASLINTNERLLPIAIMLLAILVPIIICILINLLTRLHSESETRRKIEEKLQNAAMDIENMSHHVSHELRGPLASSLGLVYLVKETVADGDLDVALNDIEKAEKSLERLMKLLDQANHPSLSIMENLQHLGGTEWKH